MSDDEGECQPYTSRPNLLSMPVTATTPMEMLSRALGMGATPETLEKLLALQERWERNTARKAYDRAIAAAKGEIPVIGKNRTVSHGTGKASWRYEDLAAIATAVDPVLAKHGLSYRFRTNVQAGLICVTCVISHQDGYSEENTLSAPADTSGAKNAIQAIGSACTYLQRYSLKAALGLAASDDDDALSLSDQGNGRPGNRLFPGELERLHLAIVEAGADTEKFCKAFGIARVEELPSHRLDEAIARLAAFRASHAAKHA
jgi:hypothetical protein